MSLYFPNLFRSFGRNINVKVHLSNYATKTDLKNVTHVDTSSFALATNLANLKAEVDILDIDVVKKSVYDKLVAKVNNIDTNYFVLKTKYQTDKTELEKKTPNVTDFFQKAKLTELENENPDISNLATKTAFTTVENDLVKKNYNTKITEIENKISDHNHKKYIDIQEFNKLGTDVFNARIAQANLITKTDFDAKLLSRNQKLLKIKQNIYSLDKVG